MHNQLVIDLGCPLFSSTCNQAMCRSKTSSRTCSHQIRLEETRGERMAAPPEMRDIEDLVQYGQETRACPYYLAREDQEEAEVTVLPCVAPCPSLG